MSDEYPKPGDTIEITWDFDDWLGKRYVVVEPPKDRGGNDNPSHAWVHLDSDKKPSHLLSCDFKIVARRNGRKSITNSDVDESLKQQRDRNLREVFT